MPLTIATWNVNSIRKRLDGLDRFVSDTTVDILCLQETKVINDLFPVASATAAGFPYQAVAGQKSYNGVAILSRFPLDGAEVKFWCGRDDCRHIFARVMTTAGPIEVHSLYVPAGGDDPDPEANSKFAYKLAFLEEVGAWLATRATAGHCVVAGDFNIAPLETDVWSHEKLKKIITHTPIERDLLTKLQEAGNWTDALRRFVPADEKAFSWWSYRAADWRAAAKGRRLDHVWVSNSLAPALSFAAIHDDMRDGPDPSDHAPVRIVLDID